jgi:hypothetical protein
MNWPRPGCHQGCPDEASATSKHTACTLWHVNPATALRFPPSIKGHHCHFVLLYSTSKRTETFTIAETWGQRGQYEGVISRCSETRSWVLNKSGRKTISTFLGFSYNFFYQIRRAVLFQTERKTGSMLNPNPNSKTKYERKLKSCKENELPPSPGGPMRL